MITPKKSPWPIDGVFHFKQCYFEAGDEITWQDWSSTKPEEGTVTKVKVNMKGRISYFVDERFVLTEEVARAAGGKTMP